MPMATEMMNKMCIRDSYMVVRALAAVERSRVALILVDATVGFTEQDSKVAGYAHDQGKRCV